MNIKQVKQKSFEELKDTRLIDEKRELTSRLVFYAFVGLLILVSISLLVYFYWTVQMKTILEIKNAPVPVRPTTIDHDQYILLHYNYCKYSNAEGVVESQLVAKTTTLSLPTAKDTTKKDCNTFDAPYPIPGQTPPETYRYHFKACYPINPIKTVCTEWDSKPFVIKSPEVKKNIELPK